MFEGQKAVFGSAAIQGLNDQAATRAPMRRGEVGAAVQGRGECGRDCM